MTADKSKKLDDWDSEGDYSSDTDDDESDKTKITTTTPTTLASTSTPSQQTVLSLSKYPFSNKANLCGHTKPVTAICIDKTGTRLVTGSADSKICFYDFSSMTSECLFTKSISIDVGQTVNALSYSPSNNELLIVSSSQQPRIVNRDGVQIALFPKGYPFISDKTQTTGHTHSCTYGQWNQYEKQSVITSSLDGTIRLWDINNLKSSLQVIKMRAKPGKSDSPGVSFVEYDPNYKNILSASTDGNVFLWDPRKTLYPSLLFIDKESTTSNAKYSSATSNSYAHNAGTTVLSSQYIDTNTIVTRGGAGDDILKAWDIRKSTQPIAKVYLPCGNGFDMSNVSISPDGKVLLAGTKSGLMMIDTISWAPYKMQSNNTAIVDQNFGKDYNVTNTNIINEDNGNIDQLSFLLRNAKLNNNQESLYRSRYHQYSSDGTTLTPAKRVRGVNIKQEYGANEIVGDREDENDEDTGVETNRNHDDDNDNDEKSSITAINHPDGCIKTLWCHNTNQIFTTASVSLLPKVTTSSTSTTSTTSTIPATTTLGGTPPDLDDVGVSVYVLYDPDISTKGVIPALSRKAKTVKHQFVDVVTEFQHGFVPGSEDDPTSKRYRQKHHNIQTAAQPPAHRDAGYNQTSHLHYYLKDKVKKEEFDTSLDPREMLSKYAEGPNVYTAAYEKTQPVPIFDTENDRHDVEIEVEGSNMKTKLQKKKDDKIGY